MNNSLDRKYIQLLKTLTNKDNLNATKKTSRTGVDTYSVFGVQIKHNMSEGFPILTTKRVAFKTAMKELRWFLNGDTNIKYLVDNNCHVWDGDAYKRYCNEIPEYSTDFIMSQEEFIDKIKTDDEFAERWGELGPIYGAQWRNWTLHSVGPDDSFPIYVDQIKLLIEQLKTNPDSRRLMVNAWNVGELPDMTLPPCHYGFQVYTRELTWEESVQWVIKNTDVELENVHIVEEIAKDSTPKRAISLMWNQRSADVPLGLPFNFVSYGALLHMLAQEVDMVPDQLIVNIGDAHIYENQLEGVLEQLQAESYRLPQIKFLKQKGINTQPNEIELDNYKHSPYIYFPLSN